MHSCGSEEVLLGLMKIYSGLFQTLIVFVTMAIFDTDDSDAIITATTETRIIRLALLFPFPSVIKSTLIFYWNLDAGFDTQMCKHNPPPLVSLYACIVINPFSHYSSKEETDLALTILIWRLLNPILKCGLGGIDNLIWVKSLRLDHMTSIPWNSTPYKNPSIFFPSTKTFDHFPDAFASCSLLSLWRENERSDLICSPTIVTRDEWVAWWWYNWNTLKQSQSANETDQTLKDSSSVNSVPAMDYWSMPMPQWQFRRAVF